MIEALSKIGVKEIILGINCQSKSKISAEVSLILFRNFISKARRRGVQERLFRSMLRPLSLSRLFLLWKKNMESNLYILRNTKLSEPQGLLNLLKKNLKKGTKMEFSLFSTVMSFVTTLLRNYLNSTKAMARRDRYCWPMLRTLLDLEWLFMTKSLEKSKDLLRNPNSLLEIISMQEFMF